jgi:superfamily II DNA or RNA helicase
MILRDYQSRDLDRIRNEFMRGCRRIVYTAPTGSGKTILFVELVRRIRATRNQRVIILVHRQELIDQTCLALTSAGLDYGVIAAGYPEAKAAIQVAMAQTLVRRLNRLAGIDFIIVDECHHACATSWRTILAAAPQARILGCTATAERLDGVGLRELFDALVVGPSVAELIAQGWLASFTVYAPARLVNLQGVRSIGGDYAAAEVAERMRAGFVREDVLAEYRKHLAGQPVITFCPTVAYSIETAAFFRANGVRSAHLDGDTPREERRRLLLALATGEIENICNCSLISEGLDVPNVTGVILLRATKSLTLHLQTIGRCLRPGLGKRAIILDHTGNSLRHGLPDFEHEWTLDGRPAQQKGAALVKRCPECGAVIPLALRECPGCGADLRPATPKPAAVPDRLVALDPEQAHAHWLASGNFHDVVRWAGRNESRLYAIARARGYRPGWVRYRLRPPRQQTQQVSP